MKLFDIKQVEKFRDVFPELTTIEQLETTMLFSLGLSKKEIAAARDVAYITVEKMLDAIKSKFNLYYLNNMLSVFQVRLVFFALTGGTVKVRRESRSVCCFTIALAMAEKPGVPSPVAY